MIINEEVQNLLDHCNNYATDLLMETGEFFPFGALTDAAGRTHHREVEIDLKNIPSNGEILDLLLEYFEDQYQNHNAKCFAISFETTIQMDKNTSTDAIAIDIRHKQEKEIPVFYIPFKVIEGEEYVQFGEMFAVKRNEEN